MDAYYSVGLDIHKKLIAYCVKAADGRLVAQGMVGADRESLGQWAKSLPGPWVGAMEATIFTGWVYTPHDSQLSRPKKQAAPCPEAAYPLKWPGTSTQRGAHTRASISHNLPSGSRE